MTVCNPQLRAGRDFESLTVSEIAEQARVTRKTFYSRAGSLNELVEGLIFDLFKDMLSQIDDDLLVMPVVGNTLSVAVLKQCVAHQAVLGPLVRHCSASVFMTPLSALLTRMLARVRDVNQTPTLPSVEQAYLVATIASVIHGVLSVWVERGFADAPSRIADFIDRLLLDGLQKILQGSETA